MKQKRRYRRRTKGGGLVEAWPGAVMPPDELSRVVHYAGSSEHKKRPVHGSFGLAADLRSDASRCPSEVTRGEAQKALEEAVRPRCVSEAFDQGFPRYVWARADGRLYAARLTNATAGHYKGWPIEEFELPTDRDGRLRWTAWEGGDGG